jgi:hypothetical protein
VYNLNPYVTILARVIGCGAQEPLGFAGGPSIELIGDASADASSIGNYVLQCSARCIRQFRNRLYIHGFTLQGAIGQTSMGVETRSDGIALTMSVCSANGTFATCWDRTKDITMTLARIYR